MRIDSSLLRRAALIAVLAVSTLAFARGVQAQGASSDGRIDFDHPGGATPAVEINIPAELLGSVIGLGDAAIEGVAEGLLKGAPDAAGSQDVKLASDQLAAIRELVGTAKGAVSEVRVRVYRGDSKINTSADVGGYYSSKLASSPWKQIVRVNDGGQQATVFVMQDSGAIRGVFVVAAHGPELVLVNVICDVSPERVRQLTEQATTMGVKFGGKDALEHMLREINRHHRH